MKNRETGIKETAYLLAKKYGWALEYEGGLEIDGEFLDDADMLWTAPTQAGVRDFVLNISWSESTRYGFVLTQEQANSVPQAGSSFGLTRPATSIPSSLQTSPFDLGSAGETICEKYFLSSVEELAAGVDRAVESLK